MLRKPEINPGMLTLLRLARARVRELERAASMEGQTQLGLSRGDVVRDVDTGARYEIESVSVWVAENNSEPMVSITAHRVYQTGRRAARQFSILGGLHYEKV